MARPFLNPTRRAAGPGAPLVCARPCTRPAPSACPCHKSLRLPARRGMAAPRCPPAFRGRNGGKASAHIASPPRATRRAIPLANPGSSHPSVISLLLPPVMCPPFIKKKPRPLRTRFFPLDRFHVNRLCSISCFLRPHVEHAPQNSLSAHGRYYSGP